MWRSFPNKNKQTFLNATLPWPSTHGISCFTNRSTRTSWSYGHLVLLNNCLYLQCATLYRLSFITNKMSVTNATQWQLYIILQWLLLPCKTLHREVSAKQINTAWMSWVSRRQIPSLQTNTQDRPMPCNAHTQKAYHGHLWYAPLNSTALGCRHCVWGQQSY